MNETWLASGLVVLSVFVVVIPALTAVSRWWLRVPAPGRATPPQPGSLDATRPVSEWGGWLAIVLPSMGAIVWLASGALHEAEPGTLARCVLCTPGGGMCHDAMLTGVALALAAFASTWWGASGGATRPRRAKGRAAEALARRVAALAAQYPALGGVHSRIKGVCGGPTPLATRGWWRPRIEVDVAWAARVGDEALAAALLHEAAHVDGRDPLRYGLARAALALNPMRRQLLGGFAAWLARREIACDRWAVEHGASPLALASAIVEAARPASPCAHPALAAASIDGVRRRVDALLRVAAAGRRTASTPGTARTVRQALLAAAAVAVVAAPHWVGTWPLTALHEAVEHAMAWLGLI